MHHICAAMIYNDIYLSIGSNYNPTRTPSYVLYYNTFYVQTCNVSINSEVCYILFYILHPDVLVFNECTGCS